MNEKLKQILTKVQEWWKNFTVKQKVLITSATAVVVVAMVILGVVLSTPKMVLLKECENTKEASDIKTLLEEKKIEYKVSSDGLSFSVREEDAADAKLELGANDITAYAYEWENLNNVFDGGFSMTEADKNKKYQLYIQKELTETLESLEAVDRAVVNLKVVYDDGTLISKDEESYAWVTLTLNDTLDDATCKGLGRAIATALGNDTTNNITILDNQGNVLFAGGDAENGTGTANGNLEVKEKAQNQLASQVRAVIMETDVYDGVSVASNLDMDYTERQVTDREVYLGEGLEAPLPSEERKYESNAIGGLAAVPGTDANDGTTYVTEDNDYSESNVEEEETVYDNSERVTSETTTMGGVDYENSSLAVVASSIRVYDEAFMRESGQLNGMSFDEFCAANEERIKLEVDPELVTMVSKATGIPEENISMVAYEVPVFQYDLDAGKDIMDYLPIILAALIMLMLGYVVFRSTRKEKVQDMESELSVEALLQSTKEAHEDLEDIGFAEKSEVRLLIEKFVEENPEAAASLLRNWLNEEWE